MGSKPRPKQTARKSNRKCRVCGHNDGPYEPGTRRITGPIMSGCHSCGYCR